MRAECYTLDLYCDKWYYESKKHTDGEFPHQFSGANKSDCYALARRQGWLIGKDKDLCPKCSGKKRR